MKQVYYKPLALQIFSPGGELTDDELRELKAKLLDRLFWEQAIKEGVARVYGYISNETEEVDNGK